MTDKKYIRKKPKLEVTISKEAMEFITELSSSLGETKSSITEKIYRLVMEKFSLEEVVERLIK